MHKFEHLRETKNLAAFLLLVTSLIFRALVLMHLTTKKMYLIQVHALSNARATPATLVAARIPEIVSDPKARGQLTPNNFPTQAKTRLEWATRLPRQFNTRSQNKPVGQLTPREDGASILMRNMTNA